MSPFLMSWLIWRARSPTVARRSASRTRAVLVRSRAVRSPRSRDSVPTSSVPSSNSTSRRSRSRTAVFSARAASGLLIRDDTHTASSSAVTPVPAAVARNQESALRSSVRSGVSGWVTRKASLHDLERRSRAGADQRHLQLADRGIVAGLAEVRRRRSVRFPGLSESQCAEPWDRRHLSPGIAQRHDDRSIAGEPRKKGFVHGDTAGQRERLIADRERLATPKRERSRSGPELRILPSPSWICRIERPVRRIAVPA